MISPGLQTPERKLAAAPLSERIHEEEPGEESPGHLLPWRASRVPASLHGKQGAQHQPGEQCRGTSELTASSMTPPTLVITCLTCCLWVNGTCYTKPEQTDSKNSLFPKAITEVNS